MPVRAAFIPFLADGPPRALPMPSRLWIMIAVALALAIAVLRAKPTGRKARSTEAWRGRIKPPPPPP